MSKKETDKPQVTFHDVAAYFSEEDWKILHEWQKELYKNVMREIHQALNSLGYQIINPDALVRVSNRNEAHSLGLQDTKRTANINDAASSCPPVTHPDILLRIKQEEDEYCRDWCGEEEEEIITPSKENDAVISFIIKEEDEIKFMECQRSERRKISIPIGDGTLNTNKKDFDSVKRTQKPSCKSSLEKNKLNILPSSENGARSISQLWSDNNHKLEGEEITNCESGFRNTTLMNSQQGTTAIQTPVTYNECESNLMNANLPTHQQSTWCSWRPYVCIVCDKSFHQKGHFIAHQRIHSGEKPYQCNECGKSFCQKNNLTRHMGIHIDRRKKKPNLKTWTQREISSQCTDNEKSFSYKDSITVEERTNTQYTPSQSTTCEKSFSESEHSLLQKIKHRVDIPDQSNECEESFNQKGPCIAQQDTCTRWIPYQLNDYKKGFSQRKHHIPYYKKRAVVVVKPYHCTECDKSFSQRGHFITHQRTHSGERPYQCTECEKSFCQKNNLTRHMRTHTGERPHQCTDCTKCYSDKRSLIIHQATHIVEIKQEN